VASQPVQINSPAAPIVTKSAPQVAVNPPQAATPENNSLHAFWSFEKGPPSAADGLDLLGSWHWENGNADGFPGMKPDDTHSVLIKFPQKIPAAPVRIKLKAMFIRKAQHAGVARWMQDGVAPAYTEWGVDREFDNARVEVCQYVIGRYIVNCTEDGKNLMNICRYEKEHPADQLCLVIVNYTVQEIELQSIREDEIPAPLRDIEKMIREMPVQAVERQPLNVRDVFKITK
jgi:hypothetical protein